MSSSLQGRAELVARLRELNALSVIAELDDARAAEVAERVDELARELRGPSAQQPWYFRPGAAPVETGDAWALFNPVSPPLRMRVDGGRATGTTVLGPEFGGPPKVVHGGYVAVLLDHALGIYLHGVGRSSLTAQLSVRYLAPTPLGSRLTVEASHSEIDGTTTYAWATVSVEGRVTARAEGRFVLGRGKWRS
ncbi:PaaI family thioesterase [Cryptosporangium minutisporangium]|uniref:Acyl-coenzyme A thioesterase THEM4 n=1 Tax=Cryptosporangium minutisporangium TaxID=113569 RepID=A0ABP6SR19_9ACTN